MKNKTKLSKNIPVILIAVISLISAGVIGFNVVTLMRQETTETTQPEIIENEFYTIKSNATDLQKSFFDELTIELDKNENQLLIAELVAKSFVADLFTWSTKDGNYDVSATQYVYGNMNRVFKNYIQDTLYGNYDLTVAQYGDDYLPEVASVEAIAYAQETEFVTHFGSYPYFYVYVSWDYKQYEPIEGSEDKIVDTTNWKKSMDLYIVIRDDGRYEVVEFY